MQGHLFESKPVDEVTTRRGTDTPMHRPDKTAGFHIQLDKWPVTPRTTQEASGDTFLHTNRGLTLLSQLCSDPAIGVRNGKET